MQLRLAALALLAAQAASWPVSPAAAQGGLKGVAPPEAVVAGLPAELAGWRKGAVSDFESRPGGAGLGAAVEYRPVQGGGGVATVYLYDRGRTDIGGGPDGPAVAEEMDAALREVDTVAAARRFRVAERRPAAPVAGPRGAPALRCTALVLAFEGGTRADSFACVGVLRGRFLKLRMTLPAGQEDLSGKALAGFGQALVEAAAAS